MGCSGASQTSFSASELLDLRGSVSNANRKGAKWCFSDAAYTHALKLVDGEGHLLINPSTDKTFGTLWGAAVVVESYADASLASGKYVVLYGRWDQAYCVRFAGPLEITRSDETDKFTYWTSVIRYQVKADADWLDKAAAKALQLA